MILFKEKFDYEIKIQREDEQGRFIILKGVIEGQPIVWSISVRRNKTKDQCTFYEEIQKELDELELDENWDVIIGGDFHVSLDAELDGTGGKPFIKESCKNIEDFCSSFDLIDVYRIRNPGVSLHGDKKTIVQRRLDFWLINNTIQEEVGNVDIIPAITTDHSAISLHINGIEETGRVPSFWNLNSSL